MNALAVSGMTQRKGWKHGQLEEDYVAKRNSSGGDEIDMVGLFAAVI